MGPADYRMMSEATGQRIAAALEALSGFGAYLTTADVVNSLTNLSTTNPASAAIINGRFKVISSGSLHDIKTPGIYYVTGAVTDKPATNGGLYAVSAYSNSLIVSFYISLDGYTYSVAYNDNAWYYYPIVRQADIANELASTATDKPLSANMGRVLNEKAPHKTTISATTTASGAVEIPSQERLNVYINALITDGGPGYVVRRDAGYFTVFANNGTPLASTSVTFDAYFMSAP